MSTGPLSGQWGSEKMVSMATASDVHAARCSAGAAIASIAPSPAGGARDPDLRTADDGGAT